MSKTVYPMTFQPVLKEKIWGGQKLNAIFSKGTSATAKVGESWEIADLKEGQSTVKNGALAGKSLHEAIVANPEALLGTKVHDWVVPKEWGISDAYIIDPNGNKICNIKNKFK